MKQLIDTLSYILSHGRRKTNRTGEDTLQVFGVQMRFDLNDGFPAVTTKSLAWRGVVSELLWFIEGSQDERRLCEILHGTRDPEKTTIWTQNAQAPYWKSKAKYEGDVGPIYGSMWRQWPAVRDGEIVYIDQLANLIDGIKYNPDSRRHILTAWNPGEIDNMALPPCHIISHFDVTDGRLSCAMTQRSADVPLGSPFNIASYSLLTHMIAQICDLDVGEFVYNIDDAHIYCNQIDGVLEQISRTPNKLPTLWLNPDVRSIDNFTMDDAYLIDYNPHSAIKIPFTT